VWQLVALPFELAPSSPAAWRDAEVADGVRLVGLRGGAVAIMAWAPRVPLETWVLPRRGREGFVDGTDDVAFLAAELRGRLGQALGDAAIDMVVEDGEPWRIEHLPRLGAEPTVTAATGLPVHGAIPEEAAAWLRVRGR
jgi:UDPglucose--hexose-1-phosphate uridylyltransferase